MEEIKKDRRNTGRLYRALMAQYFVQEQSVGYRDCSVIDLSRKGIGIKYYSSEQPKLGATILLDIFVPQTSASISVKGIIKRIRQQGGELHLGIELSKAFDDAAWKNLI